MLSDTEFQQIFESCQLAALPAVEPPWTEQNEQSLTDEMQQCSSRDRVALNFLLAGAAQFFIPAYARSQDTAKAPNRLHPGPDGEPVATIVTQALTALSSLAHGRLFAEDRVTLLADLLLSEVGSGKVLLAATVPPALRHALRSQLKYSELDLIVMDYDKQQGCLDEQQLAAFAEDDIAAVIVQSPNFFSVLEPVAAIHRWVKSSSLKTILLTDAVALGTLAPADLHADGAIDYLLGDLASMGQPQYQCSQAGSFLLSQQPAPALPGCPADELTDLSNLNSALFFLQRLASGEIHRSVEKSRALLLDLSRQLTEIPQLTLRFSSAHWLECVIRLPAIDLDKAQRILSGHNILPGYFLADDFPELEDCLLIACSDRHDQSAIDRFAGKMATVVKNLSTAGCPVKPKF